MKIFLIVPRSGNPKRTYREYPLGVGMIATALRRAGHETVVFDQAAEEADDDVLFAAIHLACPDAVGFSIITPNYPNARRQIARVKNERPDTPILVGGIHATLFPKDLLDNGADGVAIGRGEESAVAWIKRIALSRSPEGVPGIAYRDSLGKYIIPSLESASQTNTIGEIDRDVYNLSLYEHHSLLASLGCPHHCTFCCNYSGTILHNGVLVRSPEEVYAEMRELNDRFGAKRIFFADDIFFLHRRRILEFCTLLEESNRDWEWIAQLRVDSIDEAVAEAMVRAGCRRVYFGLESGSEAILNRIGKGITREKIRRGVECAKNAGMRVKTGWIYGLPGSLDEQRESLQFMRELRPHEISIHLLIPFPGTVYYDRPGDFGIKIRNPRDFDAFCYGGASENISYDYLPANDLRHMFEETIQSLEAEGYVDSDRATLREEFVFSTPFNALSMQVFHESA